MKINDDSELFFASWFSVKIQRFPPVLGVAAQREINDFHLFFAPQLRRGAQCDKL